VSDLDKMIAAVEAGNDDFIASDGWIEAWDVVAPSLQTYRMKSDGKSAALAAYAAYHGSLDAALRLHEALLSGWDYRLGRDGGDFHALVFVFGRMNEHSDGWEMCPDSIARAWLLAILKALRATPGAGDDQGSE